MPARRSSASKDLAGPEDPGDADQYVEAPATHGGAGQTWRDILLSRYKKRYDRRSIRYNTSMLIRVSKVIFRDTHIPNQAR